MLAARFTASANRLNCTRHSSSWQPCRRSSSCLHLPQEPQVSFCQSACSIPFFPPTPAAARSSCLRRGGHCEICYFLASPASYCSRMQSGGHTEQNRINQQINSIGGPAARHRPVSTSWNPNLPYLSQLATKEQASHPAIFRTVQHYLLPSPPLTARLKPAHYYHHQPQLSPPLPCRMFLSLDPLLLSAAAPSSATGYPDCPGISTLLGLHGQCLFFCCCCCHCSKKPSNDFCSVHASSCIETGHLTLSLSFCFQPFYLAWIHAPLIVSFLYL